MTITEQAIETLKQYEPEEGYLLGFSGGKDSIVIHKLAEMAGIKFTAIHNYTTVGVKSVIDNMKKYYPGVVIEYPKETMYQLIARKGLPSRLIRWCCWELKESSHWGRMWILGVRKDESYQRSQRALMFEYRLRTRTKKELSQDDYESLYLKNGCRKIVNIIVDWTDDEVWSFIREHNLPYPSVYDNGFDRVGCIGCPMQYKTARAKQFEMFPLHRKAYLWGIQGYLDRSIKLDRNNIFTRINDAELIMQWWISGMKEKSFMEKLTREDTK